MTESAIQRTNMVESQIRPSDVTDRRILRAMAQVPREQFVPACVATLAYMDGAVPLSATTRQAPNVRSLMAPRIFAKLIQLAEVESGDRVLIVGAGTGYSAAILARMAASVVALECDEGLAAAATPALAGLTNVSVVRGPLPQGAADRGPFQAIVVEGTVAERPDTLLSQLAPGGRLVAVVNEGGVGRATVWRRAGDHYGMTASFEAAAGRLPGFERAVPFVF